jgi:hypothetical protein
MITVRHNRIASILSILLLPKQDSSHTAPHSQTKGFPFRAAQTVHDAGTVHKRTRSDLNEWPRWFVRAERWLSGRVTPALRSRSAADLAASNDLRVPKLGFLSVLRAKIWIWSPSKVVAEY